MLVRILTLRFDTALDAFDDAPLVDFIKDKAVLSIKEYFFIKNETPYLAVIINYEPVQDRARKKTERRRDDAWRAFLEEKDMPLFNLLRSWRAEHSKQEGVPPYVICDNKQLAMIVAKRPQNLTGLLQIKGLGKGRVEKYGLAILEALKKNSSEKPNEA